LARYYIANFPFFVGGPMPSLPLFKYSSRARSTSWAMALCTMFIVASFSVVGGLRSSMDNLADNFSSEYYLVTRPGENGPEFFGISELGEISTRSAYGVFAVAEVDSGDEAVTAFCIDDPNNVLPETLSASGSNVLAGRSLQLSGAISLSSEGTAGVYVAGRYSSTIFAPSWLLCSREVMGLLTLQHEGMNFGISGSLADSEIEGLRSAGFSVQGLIGIVEFLDAGVKEIETDVTWVLLPSAFVIAVLAYSFSAAETSDRRHDIGILKTLGAGRRRVLSYLLLNGLLLSAWGGLLGIALGIVLSYGVSTLASVVFTSVFMVDMSELLLLLSYLVTVGAGLAGAMLPAVRMTLTSPVEDLKEVARFS